MRRWEGGNTGMVKGGLHEWGRWPSLTKEIIHYTWRERIADEDMSTPKRRGGDVRGSHLLGAKGMGGRCEGGYTLSELF